jgi:nicotinamidase-related amidase
MALEGVQVALVEAKRLLDAAREAKIPIIHVIHNASLGTPYDIEVPIRKICDSVAPIEGEPIITKTTVPNSFTRTDLDEQLKALGAKELILAGFMTHMCISWTARAGCELGYQCTVVANATATRALPGLSPSSVVQFGCDSRYVCRCGQYGR